MKRPWLLPFVPLYAAGVALRARRFESGRTPIRRLKWPVISIGNLSAGGTGKTPFAIALVQLLREEGVLVDVLSRGYGRRRTEAARVDVNGSPDRYGDEPLLIARATNVPVYVAPQRYDAGLLAETAQDSNEEQPRIHLLDDGFQHRQLHRDIDILLLNRDDLHDTLLPAGNLREALYAMRRATVLAVPADEPDTEQSLRKIISIARNAESLHWAGSIWRVRRTMEVPKVDGQVFAFCGIARPQQFFAGLEKAGTKLAGRRAFADHYAFSKATVEWLIGSARRANATGLITTEKDAIRLGSHVSEFPPDLPLKTAGLKIEIEDESAAADWLIRRVAPGSTPRAL